jgi:pyruvate dehydrogenase E1 component
LPGPFNSLGTFGFGRSEGRASLRDFFEVDAKHIAYAALYSLVQDGKLKADVLKKAANDLGINFDKPNPTKS